MNSLDDIRIWVKSQIDDDYEYPEPEDWYGGGNFDDAFELGVRTGEQEILRSLAFRLGIEV